MKLKTFKGGIHPPERKEATEALSVIQVFPSTKTVCIPVTQGGAPNSPLVKPGDSVVKGQIIADSAAPMSVPVHSSVSGIVKKIENRLVTGNSEAPCIVIEASEDNSETAFMPPLDPFTCTKEEALARIRDAGIVGMGGAAFPAHVKLNPPKGMKIDTVIGNGAECEPYLTVDARAMIENASKITDGLAIVMHITGASSGCIAVEDNKRDVLPYLEKAVSVQRSNPVGPGAYPVSIVLCKTKYPQGGEKMLISAVTGREVPSGGIPASAGCVVLNVGTLKSISEAFREGRPVIERSVTISGGACVSPKNVCVPIGTLVGDLIPEYTDLKPGVVKIIAGGPMMGVSMKNASFPVMKNTSGVLFLTEAETSLTAEGPCIGCALCMSVCACRLNPVLIVRALKADNLEAAKRYGLMDCVECGTCAYVCPASVKLVQRFRIGKQLVREEMMRQREREQRRAASAAVESASAAKA